MVDWNLDAIVGFVDRLLLVAAPKKSNNLIIKGSRCDRAEQRADMPKGKIAPQHTTALDQQHSRPITSRANCRANPRRAAARHQNIVVAEERERFGIRKWTWNVPPM